MRRIERLTVWPFGIVAADATGWGANLSQATEARDSGGLKRRDGGPWCSRQRRARSPTEAGELAAVIDVHRRTLETGELEARILKPAAKSWTPLVRRIQKLEASAKSAQRRRAAAPRHRKSWPTRRKGDRQARGSTPDDFLMIVQLVAGQARGCSDQPRGKETFADSEAAASAV